MRSIINDNVEGPEEEKYRLRNRCALFSDAVGCHSATLIPWHTGVAYYVGLTVAVYPFYQFQLGDLYYNYMSILSVVTIYILTFFGWDRVIPWFGLPSEPKVRLKSKEERKLNVNLE